MRLIQGLIIFMLILMFFSLTPVVLWILKIALAIAFFASAWDAYKQERTGKAILFLLLGLLFQPIINIGLGKALWYTIQIIVILWLLSLLLKSEEY